MKDKFKSFTILWYYLKEQKFKLFLYILLVIVTYIPALLSAFFWGLAVEYLLEFNFFKFVLYLIVWEGMYIIFYSILQYPKDKLYMDLEINL